MIRIIKKLGKLIVRLYNNEARKLNTKARAEAAMAQELALKARKLSESSLTHTDEAAKTAAQAQQLAKFFE